MAAVHCTASDGSDTQVRPRRYQSKNSPKLSVSLRVVNVLAHHYPVRPCSRRRAERAWRVCTCVPPLCPVFPTLPAGDLRLRLALRTCIAASCAARVQERLRSLVIVDAPAVFWILWNAVSPFVDSVTRAKVHFGSSKKHDATTGKLLSGAKDNSGLDEVWQIYKKPYKCSEYLDFLRSVQEVAKDKHIQAADV